MNRTTKDCFLSVRLTREEREHLNQLSQRSGLTLSNTIRACISQTELRERPPAALGQLYTEINHIGNNINQIARKMNAGLGTRADVREVRCLLRKVYEKLEVIADR